MTLRQVGQLAYDSFFFDIVFFSNYIDKDISLVLISPFHKNFCAVTMYVIFEFLDALPSVKKNL